MTTQYEQIYLETTYGETGLKEIIKTEYLDIFIDEIKEKIDNWILSNKYNYLMPDSEIITNQIAYTVLRFDTLKIQQACSCMQGIFDNIPLLDVIKIAAELFELCEGELYYLNNNSIVSNYKVDDDIIDILETKQYLPPMIVKPRDWINNSDGGWLTVNQSCIHGKINHHNQKQALDVLNILQDIEFTLDPEIVKISESPNKPLDTQEKHDQFMQMKRSSKQVYKLLQKYPKFHFVWRFDKRGRMYSQGYHVNLQSTSYKKALLNFKKKELIQGDL